MKALSQKCISLVVAFVWALCIVNGLADKATAHWHIQASGKAHHHHHPIGELDHSIPFNSSQHDACGHDHGHGHGQCGHDAQGEPLHGTSHDADGTHCCEAKVRLAQLSFTDKAPISHDQLVASFEFFSSLLLDRPVTTNINLAHAFDNPDRHPLELFQRLDGLLAPNAPPSTLSV